MDRFVNGDAKQLSRNSSNRWLRLCNRVYLTHLHFARCRRVSMTDPEKRAARERVVEQLQAAHRELVQMYKRQCNGQPAIRWSIPSKKADSDVIVGSDCAFE
jgi:hypothetical protein